MRDCCWPLKQGQQQQHQQQQHQQQQQDEWMDNWSVKSRDELLRYKNI